MKPTPVYRALLCCLALLAGNVVQAQTEKPVRVVVLDSLDKIPVTKATVVWPNGKRLTDSKGGLRFNTDSDTVQLMVSHTGYTTKAFAVLPAQKERTDTLLLSPSETLLETVVVKAPPVVQRGDTTEFNIDSSMFRPYDAVADLLRRLPGLEIDAEGRMTYQGKPITRILVDGEDLFGGEGGFSIHKLPAGMVAKIQVMDTKTLEQVLHNQLTDGEDKTLNIQLKKGNKIFGSVEGAIGTRNQLDGGGHINSFDDGRRLNLGVSSRSSNKLAWADKQNGPVSTATNGNLGYGNRWGKVVFNGNYNLGRNSMANEVVRERTQIITADTSFFTRSQNRFSNAGMAHNGSLHATWNVDSLNTLDGNSSFNKGRNTSRTQSASVTTENGLLRNESFGQSASVNDNSQASANLLWMKRFTKRERGLSVGGRFSHGNSLTEQTNRSTNTYFKGGLPVSGDTINRITRTVGTTRQYAVNVAYSDFIGKYLMVRLRADADFNTVLTNRSLYNLDSVTKEEVFDSLFSANISSITNTQNLAASIEYFNTKKWRVSTGLATVLQQVSRRLQGGELNQNLVRYTPSVNARYSISKEKQLRVDFSANTQQPTIEQIQPVPDNSNPLYVRVGNPALRTAFAQNYNLHYTHSKAEQRLQATLGYAPVSNAIVYAVYYDEFRRQTARYVNVDGTYNLRGGVSLYGTKRSEDKKRWTTLNLTGSGDYGQQAYFQNNNQYYTRTYNLRADANLGRNEQKLKPASYSVGLNTTLGRTWVPDNTAVLNTTRLMIGPKAEGGYTVLEGLYATASYRFSYNRLAYNSATRRNDEYNTHTLAQHLDYAMSETFSLSSDFGYTYNTRVPAGAPKGIPSLNMHASAELGKGKARAELTAHNLLAPQQTVQRSVGDTYIEDVQVNTLRNYFTLRVQYNMNKLQKRGGGVSQKSRVYN